MNQIIKWILLVGLIACNAHAQISQITPHLFKVNLNNTYIDQVILFLVNEEQQAFVSETDLNTWQIHPRLKPSMQYRGKNYYLLNSFPAVKYTIDWTQMNISILVPACFFDSKELNLERQQMGLRNPIPKPPPGGFLNYYTNLNGGYNNYWNQSSEFLEAGLFNRAGVGTTSLLGRQAHHLSQIIRLQSTWTYDDPTTVRTIKIGDTFTNPGMWGQSALFGGLQWGTNFSTQPSFITYPVPSMHGEAIMPSTIDLYVNNSRINQQTISPGPFTINNIPVVGGGGVLSIVTTDILGRQQITNFPYYVAPVMLKPGLQNYSIETGFIRNNFGWRSNDYGRFIISGTNTLGITNYLTGEVRGEALSEHQTAGIGVNFLLGYWGLLNLASATSYNSQKKQWGGLGQIGLQHQFPNKLSLNATMQGSTRDFIEVGIQPHNNVAPSMQGQVFLGLPFYGNSIGLGYLVQNNRAQPNVKLFTLSYSGRLFRDWVVGANCASSLIGQNNISINRNNTVCFLNIAKTIGEQTTLSANGSAAYGSKQGFVQLDRSLPLGPGFGYDLAVGGGNQTAYRAAVSAQNDVGTYIVQAAQLEGQRGYNAQVSGGLAILDNHVFLSRQITNSFGLVQVPGFENVDVYAYNQLVAHTDKHGNALIPNLMPYQNNSIRIDPNNLPINTEIDTVELNAIPYYRSGTLLRFPVKKVQGAVMTVIDENGEVLPVGTAVIIEGHADSYPIADQGKLYVNGLQEQNTLIAQWAHKRCSFKLIYVKSAEIYPDLGVVVCRQKTK